MQFNLAEFSLHPVNPSPILIAIPTLEFAKVLCIRLHYALYAAIVVIVVAVAVVVWLYSTAEPLGVGVNVYKMPWSHQLYVSFAFPVPLGTSKSDRIEYLL